MTLSVHPVGALIALAIAGAVIATIYWMLHPPGTKASAAAVRAEAELEKMVGSIIVVFSEDIHSEHMMVLAARLARRESAELLAVYVIEVPLILAENASTPDADRAGLDVLATAEAIAQNNGVHLRNEIIHARQISSAVLDLAKREGAHLIVMGSYREGKYSNAPLGRAIEAIATQAKCDVLIGVPGQHGTLLQNAEEQAAATGSGRA
ncbi:MAG: universal stress protein [Candidatus Velthaea sp.]|jgi:nucleotide-binding universal stress UspA family protein